MFVDRLCAIEGAEAGVATASGMSAVFTALIGLLRQGDRLVASRALFGSCAFVCTDILPRFGIVTDLVDGTDLTAWERALATPAKAVFLETPTTVSANPPASNPCIAQLSGFSLHRPPRMVQSGVGTCCRAREALVPVLRGLLHRRCDLPRHRCAAHSGRGALRVDDRRHSEPFVDVRHASSRRHVDTRTARGKSIARFAGRATGGAARAVHRASHAGARRLRARRRWPGALQPCQGSGYILESPGRHHFLAPGSCVG